ncbi:hypothetical protein, unknown function [Leishmania infantum JPCM5]|uniref:Amastin_surface_glycoprotein_-_putative n=2 Tax=Leishmania infantum TaxID=5671 RepID=A0A6L0XII3_LEIIN|nr:hypothetical protein, unknown function [Leishmania infantum JPCM5]CAC9502969.1 Amastin_surface_glycoprotein_-_putative [Leishmania infantum]CAM69343.1 hypothetical protein, unknown function [Leishmania infantum JPCM5]SUZ43283.1 Amastin_surface_glycoprotein_-_putative [Leishmania infantum]|eukprot:XP_001470151.1 hypothetical protein, unknown function [Leishmania infantum JPCM5]
MASRRNRSPSSKNKESPCKSQQSQCQQQESHSTEHQGTQTRSDPDMKEAAHLLRTGSGVHHSESGERSQSLTERYQHRVEQASSVWLSGILNGHSYAPRPKKVDEAELSDTAKEELLKERTYTIPRGYKYYADGLPPVLNPVPQNGFRTALIIHMIFFGIAFVFTLAAACPIPWYRGRNVDVCGVNYKDRLFSLWMAEGGKYPDIWVHAMKHCPLEKQFYQTIAVSTILGCVLSFLSLLVSGARLSGRASYGWILLFSFLAFAWTLCGNAMSISMYYSSRCNAPRLSNTARLDAGFALSLLAWVFQLGGLLAVALVTKLNVGPVLKQLRVMDTYYMALLCVSLLFLCVANAGTVWKRRFNTRDVGVVRVTYWHTELIMPNGTNLYYGLWHYRCSAYSKRMKASVSFLILSSIALFMATMLAIPAFLARGCRIASIVFSVITLVFLVISWVTAVAVRHRNSCTGAVNGTMYQYYPGVPSGIYNGLTNFPGYGVQEGLVLSIVAWVIVLGATVLNLRVPWL